MWMMHVDTTDHIYMNIGQKLKTKSQHNFPPIKLTPAYSNACNIEMAMSPVTNLSLA